MAAGWTAVALTIAIAAALPAAAPAVPAPFDHTTVTVGGRALSAIVVRAPRSRYRLGVALAGSRLGDNAWLASIAQSAGAACAINGTFFAAYAGETREPYGTLVVNGRLLHLGDFGTRLDVFDDGGMRMVRDRLQIRGSLDGNGSYPDNWYAYNLNQTPTAATGAFIYTRDRGPALGFRADLAITAHRGWVVSIEQYRDAPIPADGFVLALMGREVGVLGWKFRIGQRIAYSAVQDGAPLRTRFSLGAGPRLVDHGAVVSDAAAEGFHDPKITAYRGTRSLIGYTEDRQVLLAVVSGATIPEAAEAVRRLGAWDAMNLDDNASSSLFCDGSYLVRPGREIANALVLWPVTAP
ncbi:MAG TPA: phosphodiester glycosidase family protein [bacterium]|nr:phosphodiester glycosidase family protein [bacterium]